MQRTYDVVAQVFRRWQEDKVSRLAAALAFFAVFSLPPLLILVIAIAAPIFGHEAATGEIVREMRGLLGEEGARAIQELIKNASQSGAGGRATLISIATLLFGASGLFIALQDALNTIWGVTPKPGLGIIESIRHRLLSFTLVVTLGFMLLVSLTVSALLAAFSEWLSQVFVDGGAFLKLSNFLISFGAITFLFGAIFKVLPDVKIPWRGVWVGAVLTAALFTVGKFAIGMYLGNSNTTSVYGAAASLVVLLLWTYYTAQIFLIGAEFTRVYATSHVRVQPDETAVPLTTEARARQGMPTKRVVLRADHEAEKAATAASSNSKRQKKVKKRA